MAIMDIHVYRFVMDWWLMALAVVSATGSLVAGVEEGFDLLFSSYPTEMSNFPVSCQKPLPHWLKGTLVRNGPGRFGMGSRNFTHVFDGFAKLYSWKFDPGEPILFSTQFVRSAFYNQSKSIDSVAPFLIFDSVKPPFGYFEKVKQVWNGIDNPNINVYDFKGNQERSKYVAVSDFWQIYQFDIDTLATLTRISTSVPNVKSLFTSLPLPSSSHPLPEYGTTNFINYVSVLNPLPWRKSSINLVRIKSAAERELITRIRVRNVPYMHSFALTKNYAVLMASPFYINIAKMMRTLNPLHSLDWHPKRRTRLYVVNIKTGKVLRLKTDNTFAMHHANAYELNSTHLEMDVVTYKDTSLLATMELAVLQSASVRNTRNFRSVLKRYSINLQTHQVTVSEFSSASKTTIANNLDMPAINEKYRQQHYCYVYGFVMKSDQKHIGSVSLVKKDVCRGHDLVWYKENHYPLEPWFLPNPKGVSEDDGMIVSLALDGERRRSYLLMLDGATMETVNRCYLPSPIPFTLHGRFFPHT